MAKYLDSDGLLYFWQKLKTVFAGKVDKVEGKGLSTNDYTGAESPSWRASPQMQITTRTPPPAAISNIPSGGSAGQILRWSADGTAVWGADKDTTYSVMGGASSTADGAQGLVPQPAKRPAGPVSARRRYLGRAREYDLCRHEGRDRIRRRCAWSCTCPCRRKNRRSSCAATAPGPRPQIPPMSRPARLKRA